MIWQEGVAVAIVLLGLGAGALLVSRRPSFWIEFGSTAGQGASAAGVALRLEQNVTGGEGCVARG